MAPQTIINFVLEDVEECSGTDYDSNSSFNEDGDVLGWKEKPHIIFCDSQQVKNNINDIVKHGQRSSTTKAKVHNNPGKSDANQLSEIDSISETNEVISSDNENSSPTESFPPQAQISDLKLPPRTPSSPPSSVDNDGEDNQPLKQLGGRS